MQQEERFIQPTKEQLAIDVGDRVSNEKFGVGTVVEQWGSWYSCRECYLPVSLNWVTCPSCSKPLVSEQGTFLPLRVCAPDTVDVEFDSDGKTRSLNKVWLTPVVEKLNPGYIFADHKNTPFINVTPQTLEMQ